MTISGNLRSKSTNLRGDFKSKDSVTGSIKVGDKVYIAKLIFANHFEFPSLGDPNTLYIATDEHKIYMFDDVSSIYIVVGSDYNDIDTIIGEL